MKNTLSSTERMSQIVLLSSQLHLPKSKPTTHYSPYRSIFSTSNSSVMKRSMTHNPSTTTLNEGYNRRDILSMGGYIPGFQPEAYKSDLTNRATQMRSDRLLASIKPEDFKPILDEQRFKDSGVLEFKFRIDRYRIIIEFHDVIEHYKKLFKSKGPYNYKLKSSNLNKAIDMADVKIDCTCDDFTKRLAYNAAKKGFKVGSLSSDFDDSFINSDHQPKGSGCKHILKILQNKAWFSKYVTTILRIIDKKLDLYDKDYRDKLDPHVLPSSTFIKLKRKSDSMHVSPYQHDTNESCSRRNQVRRSLTDTTNRLASSSSFGNDLRSHAVLLENAFIYRKNHNLYHR